LAALLILCLGAHRAVADQPGECRLHDLRHAPATALLLAKVPVHVVSQRLGHANPTITLGVYAHVLSGSQRDAADVFASLIGKAGSA
jgi:integrase